ncbi:MAG: type II toxin-antitoxin system VapC family toxin [Candidatus Dormibacteraceae bacterium]
MNNLRIVLDASAFDFLDTPRGEELRALLRRTLDEGGKVCCAAVTLAEVCRGADRTRRTQAALARYRGVQHLQVIPTDERLAKQVGFILHQTGKDSRHISDAHVVAICALAEVALILTSDPKDIIALATALPGIRILTRHPASPLSA